MPHKEVEMSDHGASGGYDKSSKHAVEMGPLAHRTCRDVLFLLLFIAFWGGMIAIAIKAFTLGSPIRLLNGVDMFGNICGYNNVGGDWSSDNHTYDFTDKPVLYWPNPLDTSVQLCLKACPTETIFADVSRMICLYGDEPDLFQLGLHCWFPYEAKEVFNRCVPTLALNFTVSFVNDVLNTQGIADDIFANVYKSWPWLALGVGIAVVLGFLWLFILRFFAPLFVWLTIFLVYAVTIIITIYLFILGRNLQATVDATPEAQRIGLDVRNALFVRVVSYILIAVTVIALLLLVWMCNRIRLAIGIIQEASKAVAAIPSLMLFPGFIFLCMVALYMYWAVVALFLATAGKAVIAADSTFKGYNPDNVLRYLEIYHFFGLLWTSQFFVAINQTTIAGAIAEWYWLPSKRGSILRFPVLSSFYRTMRYHLGSLAFGSLIIAIVQFIRYVLTWLERRLKDQTNPLLKFFFKLLKCCFYCLERFLKFINKNAYIMIAIKGKSFCTSARIAFEFIFANILRVGALTVISDFLFFLGKLFVSFGAVLPPIYIMSQRTDLKYWAVSALLIFIAAYFIASLFMTVVHMAADTLLLSFCEDVKMNNGADRPYFMPKSLEKFVGKSKHKSCACCGSCCCC
eukprot:TRINITY_DN15472_c0_g1_i1.p1 TRINITY_DN15472_c0_g1~~TRINITY_DN15472_c0_g1_i1.p1  ORF type:complete len:628 (-),score=143.00 TRINITY_DN15472_c0_g1_i1:47-1930(-)